MASDESGDEPEAGTLLLIRMATLNGGRIDPARILARRPESDARIAFMAAQDIGWLDGSGYVTEAGREALRG